MLKNEDMSYVDDFMSSEKTEKQTISVADTAIDTLAEISMFASKTKGYPPEITTKLKNPVPPTYDPYKILLFYSNWEIRKLPSP
jgi:hypothetical protein